MAPLPTIADTYRCALRWVDGGQSAVNVIHVRKSATTASSIASTIDANVTAAMWGSVVPGASVTTLTVTPLDGSSASFVLNTSGAKWTGSGTAGDALIAPAVIVSNRSSFRGRSRRGRTYLPFTSESVVASGLLDPAKVTSMNTAWAAFLAAMVAAGAQPVIASYKNADQVDWKTATVESTLATQRRRQTRLRKL